MGGGRLAYLETSIGEGVMVDPRQQLFDRLLRQSVGFFTSHFSGDLLSRMNNDVGAIQGVVSDNVVGLVANLITFATTRFALMSRWTGASRWLHLC